MKQHPTVSIIIDNYNYGRFLREAIDSALHQTYAHIEVIVVDDGSTDESPRIIREYGETLTAIIKENGGQASAFNAGFRESQGEIIIFLDSDDMLMPTAVERAVAGFDSAKVAKVHWPMWRIDTAGAKTGELVPQQPLAHGNMQEKVVEYGPSYFCGTSFNPPTSGNAWSRQTLDQILPMPEADFKTGADFFLVVLASVYGDFRSLPEPEGCYRVHGTNDTLKSIETYTNTFFTWFETTSSALRLHLLKEGICADTNQWKKDSWYHKAFTLMQDISSVVPPAGTFILVDGNQLGTSETIRGRYRIPFMEKEGQYWGPPADAEEAIREIERQRANGATHIIFAWPAFWWLDHYQPMHRHLKAKYACVVENEYSIGFSLEFRQS